MLSYELLVINSTTQLFQKPLQPCVGAAFYICKKVASMLYFVGDKLI